MERKLEGFFKISLLSSGSLPLCFEGRKSWFDPKDKERNSPLSGLDTLSVK